MLKETVAKNCKHMKEIKNTIELCLYRKPWIEFFV